MHSITIIFIAKKSNILRDFIIRIVIIHLLVIGVNSTKHVYTNQFVIEAEGGPQHVKQLSIKHGFIFLGHIFGNYYHLQHHKIAKRSYDLASDNHQNSLESERNVISLSQQLLKRRVKRDFLRLSSNTRSNSNTKRAQFDDPRWPQMWYLNRGQGLDMNVQSAWAKNITGKGAVVTILDDGLEKDHPDLVINYDALASFDVNNHDEDPMPRYDMIDSNRHGTRCAGEVAANANNNICSVGVAYDAKVGGVRMLDGDVTDAVEARSLSLNPQHIDIYSASWGPDDDGKTVDGPGELATRAFIDGVTKGRNGLGSIFVWASGNGGREHDNCNCDGYTNSIWTLSISSATENGLVPWYSEACSSTLATTYSSGSFGERQIVTTDLHHGCTSSHTGTSASAPLAAGICALALQANPKLTWRDMQHIVVTTAKPANLHARDWKTNGVGRNVSHSFGYGLLDASAMVDVAKDWVTVPQQKLCEVRSQPIDKLVPAKSYIEMSLKVSCENVRYIEHVQAKVTLTATRRGDIHVYLTSPSGTRSTLLAQRPMDNSRSGFQNWPFMSVHSWGENPNGEWRLEIHNEGRYYISSGLPHSIFGRAFLKEWTLILYGTTINPDRRPSILKPLSSSFNTKKETSSVPLSTSAPVQDNSHRFTTLSVTKAPIFNIQHNNIDDNDNNEEIPLSDSQSRNMMHQGWSILVHGTRADKTTINEKVAEGSVNKGCAIMESDLRRCIECMSGFILFNDACLQTCPEGYFNGQKNMEKSHGTDTEMTTTGICNRCHYSCKHCSGANDNECIECFSDANLYHTGHCYAKQIMEEIVSLEKWYTAVAVVFVCLCFVILTLVIYILVEKNPHLLCCWTRSSHRDAIYDGLPLNSHQHSSNLSPNSIKNNRYGDVSEDDL